MAATDTRMQQNKHAHHCMKSPRNQHETYTTDSQPYVVMRWSILITINLITTIHNHPITLSSTTTTTTTHRSYKLTLVPGGVALEPSGPMPALTGSPAAAQCASQDSATVGTPMLLCRHHHDTGPFYAHKRPRESPPTQMPRKGAKRITPSVTAQMTFGTNKCLRTTASPRHALAAASRAGSAAGTPTHGVIHSRTRGATPPLNLGGAYPQLSGVYAGLQMASKQPQHTMSQPHAMSPLAVKPLVLPTAAGMGTHEVSFVNTCGTHPRIWWCICHRHPCETGTVHHHHQTTSTIVHPSFVVSGGGIVPAQHMAPVHAAYSNHINVHHHAAPLSRMGTMPVVYGGIPGVQSIPPGTQHVAGLPRNVLDALHRVGAPHTEQHGRIGRPWAVCMCGETPCWYHNVHRHRHHMYVAKNRCPVCSHVQWCPTWCGRHCCVRWGCFTNRCPCNTSGMCVYLLCAE